MCIRDSRHGVEVIDGDQLSTTQIVKRLNLAEFVHELCRLRTALQCGRCGGRLPKQHLDQPEDIYGIHSIIRMSFFVLARMSRRSPAQLKAGDNRTWS